MIDFEKLNRLPNVTRRMYVIKNICELKNVDLDYLFGLLDLYNRKNSGKWFWQKANFTGILKENYDNFNTAVDEIVKSLKQADEKKIEKQIKSTAGILDKFLTGIEGDCNVRRKNDFNYVKGFLNKNLKTIINDSLKRLR